MPAVNTIEVAATINGVAPSSRANVNRAFEFRIIASVLDFRTMRVWNAPRDRVDHLADD
jgi:hypothetical protein